MVEQRRVHVNTMIKNNLRPNCLEAIVKAMTSFKYYSSLIIMGPTEMNRNQNAFPYSTFDCLGKTCNYYHLGGAL